MEGVATAVGHFSWQGLRIRFPVRDGPGRGRNRCGKTAGAAFGVNAGFGSGEEEAGCASVDGCAGLGAIGQQRPGQQWPRHQKKPARGAGVARREVDEGPGGRRCEGVWARPDMPRRGVGRLAIHRSKPADVQGGTPHRKIECTDHLAPTFVGAGQRRRRPEEFPRVSPLHVEGRCFLGQRMEPRDRWRPAIGGGQPRPGRTRPAVRDYKHPGLGPGTKAGRIGKAGRRPCPRGPLDRAVKTAIMVSPAPGLATGTENGFVLQPGWNDVRRYPGSNHCAILPPPDRLHHKTSHEICLVGPPVARRGQYRYASRSVRLGTRRASFRPLFQ